MPRPVVWYTDGDARHATSSPERKLWAAVLEGCRDDVRLGVGFEDVRAWVCSPSDVVQSFNWLCDVLGLDPERTREAVLYPRPAGPRGGRDTAGGPSD